MSVSADIKKLATDKDCSISFVRYTLSKTSIKADFLCKLILKTIPKFLGGPKSFCICSEKHNLASGAKKYFYSKMTEKKLNSILMKEVFKKGWFVQIQGYEPAHKLPTVYSIFFIPSIDARGLFIEAIINIKIFNQTYIDKNLIKYFTSKGFEKMVAEHSSATTKKAQAIIAGVALCDKCTVPPVEPSTAKLARLSKQMHGINTDNDRIPEDEDDEE